METTPSGKEITVLSSLSPYPKPPGAPVQLSVKPRLFQFSGGSSSPIKYLHWLLDNIIDSQCLVL